jgi:hypothetical protein
MMYKILLWGRRNSVCNLPISLRAVLILSSYLHTFHLYLTSILLLCCLHPIMSSGLITILSCYVNRCLTRGLFASVLPSTTVYPHLIPFMQATCPNRLFLLDVKIPASLLGPYNILSILSQAPSACILPLIWKTHPPPFPTKQHMKL